MERRPSTLASQNSGLNGEPLYRIRLSKSLERFGIANNFLCSDSCRVNTRGDKELTDKARDEQQYPITSVNPRFGYPRNN
jgi:hypothetical protein